MIHFVVAVGTPAAVDRLVPRLVPALDHTRLFEGERVERVGACRTWAAAAIAAPDPTCAVRLAADQDAIVIVNGPALNVGGNQARLAQDILQAYRSGGTSAVSAALGGAYNFVGVAPSTGLRAFADFSGLFPLYWHQGEDFAVLSNRSTTVADVGRSEGWDCRALAWVIGHANLFGDHMPARDVTYLPPGREARVEWGDGEVRVGVSPVWVWPTASDDPGRENLGNGEWDEVTHALVANFRALRTLAAPLRLPITGGKDSRLCLALAKAAGLQDCVETYTAGTVDSPEVECAAAVAQAAGFPHKRPSPAPARSKAEATPSQQLPQPFDAEAVWHRLRQDSYRYEGIICLWSGLVNPLRKDFLNIKGFGGEFYRRGNAKQFRREDVGTLDALASRFIHYHQMHDPLGILQPDEAMFQADWLRAWVYKSAEHVRFDLLPEKFYVDYRLGHWSGPLVQATPEAFHVNPLLLPSVARKNLELSAPARSSERFHFEVMRRAAPELVALPFLNDIWAPELAADSAINLPREPFPTAVKATKRVLSQRHGGWPFLENEGKAIALLFTDAARETEMGAICDMRKLRRIGRRSAKLTSKRPREFKELFSSIGVALTLLDRAEPVLDSM